MKLLSRGKPLNRFHRSLCTCMPAVPFGDREYFIEKRRFVECADLVLKLDSVFFYYIIKKGDINA